MFSTVAKSFSPLQRKLFYVSDFLFLVQTINPSSRFIKKQKKQSGMYVSDKEFSLRSWIEPFHSQGLLFHLPKTFQLVFLAHLSQRLKWAFLITIIRLSVVAVGVGVVVVKFSHFLLLLQNHWANFNQTWHKVSLSEGDLSFFKWRASPFS